MVDRGWGRRAIVSSRDFEIDDSALKLWVGLGGARGPAESGPDGHAHRASHGAHAWSSGIINQTSRSHVANKRS